MILGIIALPNLLSLKHWKITL